MATLRHVIHETLPDAHELVTPPQRPSAAGQEAAPAVAGSSTPTSAAPFPIHAAGHSGQQQHQQQTAAQQLQPQPSSQPRPPYTLREGIGMRRLLKFRVKASVQLLLVQATSEMYAAHNQHIKVCACLKAGVCGIRPSKPMHADACSFSEIKVVDWRPYHISSMWVIHMPCLDFKDCFNYSTIPCITVLHATMLYAVVLLTFALSEHAVVLLCTGFCGHAVG